MSFFPVTQRYFGNVFARRGFPQNKVAKYGCFFLACTYDPTRISQEQYSDHVVRELLRSKDCIINTLDKALEWDKVDAFMKSANLSVNPASEVVAIIRDNGINHFIRRYNDGRIYDPARGIFHASLRQFFRFFYNSRDGFLKYYQIRNYKGFHCDVKNVRFHRSMARYDEWFSKCIMSIIDYEGSYSDDKSDTGGKTFFGLSHTTFGSGDLYRNLEKLYAERKFRSISEVPVEIQKRIIDTYSKNYRDFESLNTKLSFQEYKCLLAMCVHMHTKRTCIAISRGYESINASFDYVKCLDAIKTEYRKSLSKHNNRQYRVGWSRRLSTFSGYSIQL